MILPPFGSNCNGTYSVSGSGDITTPAAWTLICLAQPSIRIARSNIFFVSVSFSYASLSSGTIFIAFLIVIGEPCAPIGISLDNRSPTPYGYPNALAVSLTDPLAIIVPKVPICATLSDPYFLFAYSITSSRLLSAKSISISGAEGRSGFKNLSNGILYSSGSIFVIPSRYVVIDPATDPL